MEVGSYVVKALFMKREIVLNGESIVYELMEKRIKNVNIRIRWGGIVTVSAPVGLSVQSVESVLRKKGGWICEALNRVRLLSPECVQTGFGETVWLFGKSYRLLLCFGTGKNSEICGDALCLVVPEGADKAACERIYLKWRERFFQDTIRLLCKNAFLAFQGKGIFYPQIAFRTMKARWGSCLFRKKKVIFNRRLIEVPIDGVEYVVYHEFAHLCEPNHSRRFYAVLDDVLPDWRAKKKVLEE